MSFEQELTKEINPEPKKGKLIVNTDFFGMAWFLYFVTPVIEINGKRMSRPWGTSQFDIDPGDYTVKIFFSYLFMSECGANSVNVRIEEGKSKKVTFYMPPWMMAKGRMKVLG